MGSTMFGRWRTVGPVATGLVLAGILGCGGGDPPPPPPPVPTVEATPSPAGPDPAKVAEMRAEADRITSELDRISRDTATKLNEDVNAYKDKFPWEAMPDLYRKFKKATLESPEVEQLWLDNARRLCIPYTYLADAVSRNPEDPNAPFIMTMDKRRKSQDHFEATFRRIGKYLVQDTGHFSDRSRKHVATLFLIMSGDTREAGAVIDGLAPPPEGKLGEEEVLVRTLCKTLLRWGVKEEPVPTKMALTGIEKVTPGSDPHWWDWGLITAYGSILSLFHPDYGSRTVNPQYYDQVLTLVGKHPDQPPRIPKGVQQYLVDDVRFLAFDSAQRGLIETSPKLQGESPEASEKHLRVGNETAWLFVCAADFTKTREIGPLWFHLLDAWLTNELQLLHPKLRTTFKPEPGKTLPDLKAEGVQASLDHLEAGLDRKIPDDPSGVLLACKAVIQAIEGDPKGGLENLAKAKKLAVAFEFTAQDAEIQGFLKALEEKLTGLGS